MLTILHNTAQIPSGEARSHSQPGQAGAGPRVAFKAERAGNSLPLMCLPMTPSCANGQHPGVSQRSVFHSEGWNKIILGRNVVQVVNLTWKKNRNQYARYMLQQLQAGEVSSIMQNDIEQALQCHGHGDIPDIEGQPHLQVRWPFTGPPAPGPLPQLPAAIHLAQSCRLCHRQDPHSCTSLKWEIGFRLRRRIGLSSAAL